MADTIWPIEDHTRAKHQILRRYLGGWFPILTTYGQGRVVYLDGFSGPGIYTEGEPGSPIIALDTLITHPHFGRLNRSEFVFLFVERAPDRCDNLNEELTKFWSLKGGQPSNVKVRVIQSEFAHMATAVLDFLRQQKKTLVPTFALIDPFGWTGIPLKLIGELLAFQKCEALISFMFDPINRFLEHPDQRQNFAELFGSDRFQEASVLSGDARKQFLHDLYRSQLRDVAGFDHVLPFEMVNVGGHTVYSLFYGTRNITGVRVMKDALWSIDPATGLRFSDRLVGQRSLFSGANLDVAPLREALLGHFYGKTVPVEEIERFVLLDTPYSAGHYKRVLKALQAEGFIEPVRGQTRKGSFPEGTVLRFR